MDYSQFLVNLDARISEYETQQKDYLCCRIGCSLCCEKGDYPLSQIELEYLMQGYIALDNSIKITVQKNIKNMIKGEACPFLINKKCSVYKYRPIICRVHGLAYLCKNDIVKIPYCVNQGKNFKNVYNNNQIRITPIKENLDTHVILKDLNYGEIRNLYDWIK